MRKQRRARRVRPAAKRALFSFAIGVSLVGGLVLLGVAATALTPRNTLGLVGALAIATAFGWPLSAMLISRLQQAHEAKAARGGAPVRHIPARPAPARSRLVPNPMHPSSRLMPDPPSRRRS